MSEMPADGRSYLLFLLISGIKITGLATLVLTSQLQNKPIRQIPI